MATLPIAATASPYSRQDMQPTNAIEYRINTVYCLLKDKYGEEITYSVGSVVQTPIGKLRCVRVYISLNSGKTVAVWAPEY